MTCSCRFWCVYWDKASVDICLLKTGMTSQACYKFFVSFQTCYLEEDIRTHTRTDCTEVLGVYIIRIPDTVLNSSVTSSRHSVCLCPTQPALISWSHNSLWPHHLYMHRINLHASQKQFGEEQISSFSKVEGWCLKTSVFISVGTGYSPIYCWQGNLTISDSSFRKILPAKNTV